MARLGDLPEFLQELLSGMKPEIIDAISEDAWEGRILPLLAEMQVEKKFERARVQYNEKCFWLIGAAGSGELSIVPALKKYAPDLEETQHGQPQGTLYFFDECTDLSVLRRFKEYPDETGREQLESYWAGFYDAEPAMILVNPGRK